MSVLRRWRVIVAIGLLLGIALAILASFRVTSSGLEWRKPVTYSSSSVLLVTQVGFPWGRAIVPQADGNDATRTPDAIAAAGPQFADPSRYVSLATIYSFMVRSQPVLDLVPSKPTSDHVAAQPFRDNGGNGSSLPLVGVTVTAPSAAGAVKLNQDVLTALKTYVKNQQDDTQTPRRDRAAIQVFNPAGAAVIAEGHKLTKSVLALLLCTFGAVALAYVLENLRLSKARQAFDDLRVDELGGPTPAVARSLVDDLPPLEPLEAGETSLSDAPQRLRNVR
jgi:hypothetical protein